MYMLYVVPYIEGDQQDANHIRVQLHHADGISNRHVIIRGAERYVRSTSRICDWQRGTPEHGAYGKTILVHLKPLPSKIGGRRLQCKDLSTLQILRRIKRTGLQPTVQETVFDNPDLNITPHPRLIKRKMSKLVAKGYIGFSSGRLTDKGLRLLAALELAERQDG